MYAGAAQREEDGPTNGANSTGCAESEQEREEEREFRRPDGANDRRSDGGYGGLDGFRLIHCKQNSAKNDRHQDNSGFGEPEFGTHGEPP